jgi:hypothetical protein
MLVVRSGNFPSTTQEFLDNYLLYRHPTRSSRTSEGFAESVSSIVESSETSVDSTTLPVTSLSKFSRRILYDLNVDFGCHVWNPTDDQLYECLSSAVPDGLDSKLDYLVSILEKLRDMTTFSLTQAHEKKMTEDQFQPLVKRLMTEVLRVLGTSGLAVEPCQQNFHHKLSMKITVSDGTKKLLRGESDLARVGVEDDVRYFELKPVGGTLSHSSAWQAKSQALGQTVCSSTAKSGVAIGGLLDLITVCMIVTSPVKEDSRNVVSWISARLTNSRSWILRVAVLLVVPTDSITDILPPLTEKSCLQVHSDDAGGEEEAGVGDLNLNACTHRSDRRGATSANSSGSPSGAFLSKQAEDAAACRWIAREDLRDQYKEKVRTMLVADARLDGFSYLCKENLEEMNERATTVRPHGDRGCTFWDLF